MFIAMAGRSRPASLTAGATTTQPELERMANYLNEGLEGRTLEQARDWIESVLKEERTRYDRFIRDALTLGDAVVSRPVPVEVYVEGSAKALQQPEFSDPGKLKELLGALEDKSALFDLLERTLKVGNLEVSIGAEHDAAPERFECRRRGLFQGCDANRQPWRGGPDANGLRTRNRTG